MKYSIFYFMCSGCHPRRRLPSISIVAIEVCLAEFKYKGFALTSFSLSTYFLFEKNVAGVASMAMRDEVVADYGDFLGEN